jgi:hypothetical protein
LSSSNRYTNWTQWCARFLCLLLIHPQANTRTQINAIDRFYWNFAEYRLPWSEPKQSSRVIFLARLNTCRQQYASSLVIATYKSTRYVVKCLSP